MATAQSLTPIFDRLEKAVSKLKSKKDELPGKIIHAGGPAKTVKKIKK